MKKFTIRWQLVFYDIIIFGLVEFLLLYLYKSVDTLSTVGIINQVLISFICIFSVRIIGRVYQQIWRYGGIQSYIKLLLVDFAAFIVNLIAERLFAIEAITFARLLAISCTNLLGALAIRMMYRYAFKCGNDITIGGKFLRILLKIFAGIDSENKDVTEEPKINIAIIGAGSVGVALAEELLASRNSQYIPRCFVDISKYKTNRIIHGIPVLLENEVIFEYLRDLDVREVVFAIPNTSDKHKKNLYEKYLAAGFKIKLYDYPIMQSAGSKRYMREFDIEELLFRKSIVMDDKNTNAYYQDKTILVTGGGGSIGSEMLRQLAKMNPKQLIALDIYENGIYDVQMELKMEYGSKLNFVVEIASITNEKAMHRVFKTYKPQIVINAAAHKHVPLMEHNCVEAVENNVFGTKILVDLCEEFSVERFMMVSTDKAVNPTNVMGATKRMCEMIVGCMSTCGKTKYSSTRFGNVLGSAGSVIPLFKKQIAKGGPVTITDKRIIRYFMTIPEASQLVLQSGVMAKNGELFVLDMGQPIKILELAQNMIRLSGVRGIEIIETGLRPGEKLYEELLCKTEELDKTENSLIFIERDLPLTKDELNHKLEMLREACDSGDDEKVREALKIAVPTFKTPDEINSTDTINDELSKAKLKAK